MKRALYVAYAVFCYLMFLASFLYAIGFVGDFVVPHTLDSGPNAPLGVALLIDAALLAVFALQHSVMARRGFKRWWTKIIPKPIERSTYVLLASLALFLLYWQWRPIGGTVWQVNAATPHDALIVFSLLGWGLIVAATFVINHWDLFGLRQAWLYATGRRYEPLQFTERSFYKYLRHPLMLGFFIAFWSTPKMTVGHLIFALATTAYILVALQLEERDLLHYHGDAYQSYRERVPMLLPIPRHHANEHGKEATRI